MSKHTPGPWSVPHMARDEVACNCAYVLAEPYMGSICTISISDGKTISDFGNDCPPLDEARANARLIAAAPDLLEAMQAAIECGMVPVSSAKEGGATAHSQQVRVADQIRDAIAKATGVA